MSLHHNKSAQANRITSLDGLRGLAALLVVVYHYVLRYDELYGHANISFPTEWAIVGKYGVHLFFIISGYVIYWTLSRSSSGQDFIVSRFARLYPAYWAAAFITWLAVAWAGLPGREVTPLQALANITMLQEYVRIPHIDGVYWTLTMELTFYFYAFLLFKGGLVRYFELIALAFVTLVIIRNIGMIPMPGRLARFLLFDFGPFFILGMAYYRITNKQGPIIALALVMIAAAITPMTSPSAGNAYIIISVYITFLLAMNNKIPFMTSRTLIFFGGISYTLYLTHQNIGYIIIRAGEHHNINAIWSMLIAAATSILIATLITKIIERPAQAIIREKYKDFKDSKKAGHEISPRN